MPNTKNIFIIVNGILENSLKPSDIDLSSGLYGTLSSGFYRTSGEAEVEIAAKHLILFCRIRGGWYPFTMEELLNFYKKNQFDIEYMLFGLLGPWWDDTMIVGHIEEAPSYLVAGGDGKYYFTNIFIERCSKYKK